jgi:hypothetical protein
VSPRTIITGSPGTTRLLMTASLLLLCSSASVPMLRGLLPLRSRA